MYDWIPESSINEKICIEILSYLDPTVDDEHYTISLSTVLHIDSVCKGFFLQYMRALSKISSKIPDLASGFLHGIDNDNQRGPSVAQIAERLEGELDLLRSVYINALHGRDFYDDEGRTLIQLARENHEFLSALVDIAVTDQRAKSKMPSFSVLWKVDNYNDLVSEVMNRLKKLSKRHYITSWDGEDLFSCDPKQPEICSRQDEWLDQHITCYAKDMDDMRLLFRMICTGTEERLLNAIKVFCKNNISFEDFSRLSIEPDHMSWSGSEVPLLEKRIAALERIREALPGFEYIEHRESISAHIQNLRKYKEGVLLEEFLSGQ